MRAPPMVGTTSILIPRIRTRSTTYWRRRVRFTIAHELGHHLLLSAAADLLDDLDTLRTSAEELNALEESVCHQFAGALLVPDTDITEVIGDNQVLPGHIMELYRHGAASLEAIAIRVAGTMGRPGAVVIMNNESTIGFCASSPELGLTWWRRGSSVDPVGPLSRATTGELQAVPDTYRYGLAYSSQLYCDTLPVSDKLAIAVLCDRPSSETWAGATSAKASVVEGAISAGASHPVMIRCAPPATCEVPEGQVRRFVEIANEVV